MRTYQCFFPAHCLALLLILPGIAVADALASLSQSLAGIKTYHASFSQKLYDQQQTLLQQSNGVMYAARPGKLHWQSDEPYVELIVVDGEHIWRYEEDLQQVVLSPYEGDLGATPALLLSGDVSSIAERYTVSKSDGQYQLLPRDDQSLFRAMGVRFEQDKLVALVMEDSLGQTTVLEFSDIELNSNLDATLFVFEPPPGVDILKDE